MRTTFASMSGSARPTEDFVAASDELVVMLDGATTPGAVVTGCTHTTRWFARGLGVEVFRQVEDDSARSLADSLALAIQEFARRHARTCDVTHPGHPSATVALLQETADAVNYLVLADSTIVVNSRADGVLAITDDRLDTVAAADHAQLLATAHGTEQHDAVFAEFTTKLQEFRNQPGGFWVASTNPEAAYQGIAGKVSQSDFVSGAVLTDGASRLVDRFEQASWPEALNILGSNGPGHLIDLVRKAEATDPNGKRWPRGKVHDDAAAAYCLP